MSLLPNEKNRVYGVSGCGKYDCFIIVKYRVARGKVSISHYTHCDSFIYKR